MFKMWEKINALENILGKIERKWYLLLLLLSRFSHVRLCATPEMATHQAPMSLGFSRQEHWSGLPLPSPMHESESQSEVTRSCPTLSDPMDCSPPGSSVHGILQVRVLEWGAIAVSYKPFLGHHIFKVSDTESKLNWVAYTVHKVEKEWELALSFLQTVN